MHHFIYKTVRKDGRYYIGMHSTENLDDGYMGSGLLISASVKKHGRNAHHRQILERCESRKDLERREAEIVTPVLLDDPLCMNLVSGGRGGFEHTYETRSKIGNKLRGRPQSEAACERKRISLAGNNKGLALGFHWFNNGIEHRRFATCPNGWFSGRIKTDTVEARHKKGTSTRGTMWVNNGITSKRLISCPDGWTRGRI